MCESLMPDLRAALALALLLALPSGRADEAKKQEEAAPCIEVLVNGERIPAWDCLQRKLAPATRPAKSAALPEAERLMQQPGNQLMQYNWKARGSAWAMRSVARWCRSDLRAESAPV